jgi:hypothetical protein
MSAPRYNVCVPRQYVTASGEKKTHFWPVGVMFPLKEQDGFTIKLWTKLLVTDQLVMFAHEPREKPTDERVDEDGIPF